MSLAQPHQLVASAGLPPSSHLQRVLRSELDRLEGFVPPDGGNRESLGSEQAGPFELALRSAAAEGGAVIAEYKQGSPSLGPFAAGTPLLEQLRAYQEGGAAAFSILVEPAFFLGSAAEYSVAVDGLGDMLVTAERQTQNDLVAPGERVAISFDPGPAHIFPA